MGDRRLRDLLNALRHRDLDEYERVTEELDRSGWTGAGAFVGAAFYTVVNRRFARHPCGPELGRFVAELGAMLDAGPYLVDALLVERLTYAVMGGDTSFVAGTDPGEILRAEIFVLYVLLGDVIACDVELESLLDEIVALADRWSSRPG